MSTRSAAHTGSSRFTLGIRALGTWLLILVLAVVNGGIREAFLVPRLGNPAALIISGLLLITCIAVVAYSMAPHLGARSRRQLAAVGVSWVGLTLAFEFAFGFARGKSWAEMLSAYSFADGNLWLLVLLFTLVAPVLFGTRREHAVAGAGAGQPASRQLE